MTAEQYNGIFNILTKMGLSIKAMAEAAQQTNKLLAQLVASSGGARAGSGNQAKAPGYQKQLADFPNFDWPSIGATIIDSDRNGVMNVEWQGYQYTRRRGNADFDPVIYFSRSTGMVEGKRTYEWLITFREPTKAKKLPEETLEKIEEKTAERAKAEKRQPGAQKPICSALLWKQMVAAATEAQAVGVESTQWKPKLQTLLGCDDPYSMRDDQITKAIAFINGLTATAQLTECGPGELMIE